jgi:serine/threonine-protein kinase
MTTDQWLGIWLAGGRYHVKAKLGEGGMGFVYRAWDKNLDSDVVVKVPRAGMLCDADFSARFAREIRSLVKLAHPHIVRISDVGEHAGLPFAVMQYLPGGSLKERQPRDPSGGTLPCHPRQLRDWVAPVSDALDFIHSQGYVHRDVKPANILFDAHGNAFLSDFGIAKVLADSGQPAVAKLTGTGLVLGTPEYMPPELIMGQSCDGRSDQYSLAITIYEVLTGRVPFDGPTPSAILVRHTSESPAALHELDASIPQDLSYAVSRALSKKPHERFATCRTFAESVIAFLECVPASRAPARVATREVVAGSGKASAQSQSVSLPCPFCGQFSRVTIEMAGRLLRCSKCNKRLQLSPDLMQLGYAIEDDTLSAREADAEHDPAPQRLPQKARGTDRVSPAVTDTRAQGAARLAVPVRRGPDRLLAPISIGATVVALICLVAGLLWILLPQQRANDRGTAPSETAGKQGSVGIVTAKVDPANPSATQAKAIEVAETGESKANADRTVTGATGNQVASNSKNRLTELPPKITPTGTPSPSSKPEAVAATMSLSPAPEVLMQGLLSIPLRSGSARELQLCRDIAQLAHGNLAMAAIALSQDEASKAQRYREATHSMDTMNEAREWSDVDGFFDEYAKAIRQLCALLGSEPAISGGRIQQHVLLSESYSAALNEYYRTHLPDLAEELMKIEAQAELEKLVAMNSLHAICQSQMSACRTLSTVAIERNPAVASDVRQLLAGAIDREYADSLEQLRSLLVCQLHLWARTHPGSKP